MNDKLTLQELIDLLAARHQMEPQDADAFVRAFWALIEEGLKSDNYVKIKGLGTFKLIDTEARESINIQTGERIEIQSHSRVTFTPEASLRDLINRPFAHFETVVLNETTNFDDLDEVDEKTTEDDDEQSSEVEEVVDLTAAEIEDAVESDSTEVVVEDAAPSDVETHLEEASAEVELPSEMEAESADEISLEKEIATAIEDPLEEEVTPDADETVESEVEEEIDDEKESPSEVSVVEECPPVDVQVENNTESLNIEEECPVEQEQLVETPAAQEVVEEKQLEETPVQAIVMPQKVENPLQEIIESPTKVGEERLANESFCRKSKRRLSWCVVICALLVGIIVGGFTSLYILFGSTDLSDNLISSISHSDQQKTKELILSEKEISEEESIETVNDTTHCSSEPLEEEIKEINIPQPVEDVIEKPSEEVIETPVSEEKDQPVVKEKTKPETQEKVKPVVPKKEKPAKKVVAKPAPKETYFSEKIQYKIIGTQATYTLRPGETLTRVALKFYGNKKIWPYLVMHNKGVIKNPDNVPIGTTIKIPRLAPQ